MFKNLFGKKDKAPQMNAVAVAVHNSILQMLNQQVFMHYFDKNTKPNPADNAWQNQAIFFWNDNEPFDKKSLPPEFKSMEEKYFIINQAPQDLKMNTATAIPWFGMPGGGTKQCFVKGGQQIEISKLVHSKVLSYVEIVTLTQKNLDILKDRANYFLMLDNITMKYDPMTDKFFFKDKEVTLGGAYQAGGVKVIKMTP